MARQHPPSVWMWAQACELIDHADRLHRQFFRPGMAARAFAAWEPPIDVFEDGREIVVIVAMPGVPADRVQVLHEAGQLVIRGTRPGPLRGSGHRVRALEIPYGGFERRIPLPPGRLDAGQPVITEGCLVITLTKLDRDFP